MSEADLVAAVHRLLLEHPDADPADLLVDLAPLVTADRRAAIIGEVEARRSGLGALDRFFADPTVSEVMINGPGPIWIERHGRIESTEVELDRAEIDRLVERLVTPIGRRVDQRSPCVDARLADGSRVHVVIPPIALDGPYVTIRRFVLRTVELEAFVDGAGVGILCDAIATRRSVVVSGGTGSGKTTLLNAIAAHICANERLVTVEDAAELQLRHPHVVRLESRPESAEGVGLLTIRDLVRNALRMRPDRLIVGEVRGEEAFDLMHALNTGHRGCLCTVHANSPIDALRRLEGLAVMGGDGLPLDAVRAQLWSAIDVIVHVERGSDGSRNVTSIADVVDERLQERWPRVAT